MASTSECSLTTHLHGILIRPSKFFTSSEAFSTNSYLPRIHLLTQGVSPEAILDDYPDLELWMTSVPAPPTPKRSLLETRWLQSQSPSYEISGGSLH